jgi:hypothetical protein
MNNTVAYHGTAHNVDIFSTDYIGTGDGTQLHGWGLYFAGDKKVAEHFSLPDGNLYEVSLKVEETELLDWDKKPNKKTVNKIIKALRNNNVDIFVYGNSIRSQKDGNSYPFDLYNGSCLYGGVSSIFESDDRKASEFLHMLGIKGIKFSDRTSLIEGAYNYVIFDDKDVKILSCNGKTLNGKTAPSLFLREDAADTDDLTFARPH